jgi:hypothetical protein
MFHLFLFVGAVLALLSIVPLSTWAATGRWSDAVRAGKEFMQRIGLMVAAALVLAVCGFIAMSAST